MSLMVAGALGAAGCGSGDAPPAAEAPGVPTAIAPWRVVASSEITGRPESTSARLSIARDGRGAASWLEGDRTREVRFVLPTGPSTALRVITPPPAVTPPRSTPPSSTPQGSSPSRSTPDPAAPQPTMGQVASTASATNRAGTTLAAWVEYDEVGEAGYRAQLRAAITPPGGRLGTPVTLQSARPYEPYLTPLTVAADDDGRLAVVAGSMLDTDGPAQLLAWTATGAGPLGEPISVVPAGAYAGYLDAEFTGAGRLIVVWEPPQAGEDEHPPTPISAATLAPGTSRFTAKQVVEPGTHLGYPQDFALELGAGDRAWLVWSGDPGRGDEAPLLAARTNAAGRFSSTPQRLARGLQFGGATAREDGALIVTATAGDTPSGVGGGRGSAFVLRAGADRFGPAEELPLPASVPPPSGPAATTPTIIIGAPTPTFDPRSGRAAIAYVVAAKGKRKARLVVAVRDAP